VRKTNTTQYYKIKIYLISFYYYLYLFCGFWLLYKLNKKGREARCSPAAWTKTRSVPAERERKKGFNQFTHHAFLHTLKLNPQTFSFLSLAFLLTTSPFPFPDSDSDPSNFPTNTLFFFLSFFFLHQRIKNNPFRYHPHCHLRFSHTPIISFCVKFRSLSLFVWFCMWVMSMQCHCRVCILSSRICIFVKCFCWWWWWWFRCFW